MASDLLGISISGLRYSQAALSTTGHNISNAGTEGYSRQSVQGVTNPATYTGAGYIGNGVNVDAIARSANEFVTEQLRSDSSLYQSLNAFNSYAGQLNGLLSDSATGLSGALENFFASVQNSANDPTSIPARQLVIGEAENLADRFNSLHNRFESIERSVNSAINTAVAQVNSLAENVANLNQKIVEASSTGQPNDLLDQRDEVLRQLSELINFRTLQQDDGRINIMIGKGESLVLGNQVRKLEVAPNAIDPTKNDLVVQSRPPQVVTDSLAGGQLGGLLRFREGPLAESYNELGRIAVVMADSFNQIHQQGIGLDNEFGGDFFFDPNEPSIAAHRISEHSGNSSHTDRDMLLNISDSSQIKASDYRVSLEHGVFTVTRLADNRDVTSGAFPGSFPHSIEFDGLELVINEGTFENGDEFLLKPVADGAEDFSAVISDPKAIAFAGAVLSDASIGNVGSAKISGAQLLNSDALAEMPLVVEFTSETAYRVLSYADANNPVELSAGHSFASGMSNSLFSADPANPDYRGVQATISGKPQPGDRFTINFNKDGAGDNRNGLALVNLQASATIDGAASFSQGYGALVEEVGIQTSSSKTSKQAAEHALKQTTELRESISGVNLDEEAANLIRFEQLYSANAQVISVARDLFDRLINSF